MPITLSIGDAAYQERLAQGSLAALVDGLRCPVAACGGRLALTSKLRGRGLVRRVGDRPEAGRLTVAIACCNGPSGPHYVRVLPANVLPRKTYSVEVQALACERYLSGKCGGLRPAVRAIAGDTPHFTTLHGWLGGLGQVALGRGRPTGTLSIAALRSETARRDLPELDRIWEAPVAIDPQRYRSEARRDLLVGVARLLRTARYVASEAASSLAEWIRRGVEWCGVYALSWWARFRRTPIQPGARRTAVASQQKALERGGTPCRIRTRSPPGDSR